MQSEEILRQNNLFNSDLYQFTCSYSYFMSNKHEQTATFEIFFRKYPFGGKYVIFGGLRSVKDFFDNLSFTQKQEKYLKDKFPHMKQEYFTWLKENIKKTKIDIKSMKQGQFVFSKEPLVTYTGPLAIVQLFETPILNLLGFASLVATNASRMVKAVSPKNCIEFGIRRAQGPDGANTASEFSFLGGFIGTSNIHAASKLKIPCVGTMSHAYITSFDSLNDVQDYEMNGINILKRVLQYKKQLNFHTHEGQLAAFVMYAKAFPDNFTTLIDTYSTLQSGILNTILISKAMIDSGYKKFGVRLDSGDLAYQSRQCRKIWNQYIKQIQLTIVASDDLYEERLLQIQRQGSQIDVYAIGTNIATCKKQPALGLVCKLVELNGVPKMKFSEDPGKATYPSKKTVTRIWMKDEEQASLDVISLEGQQLKSPMILYDPDKPLKKYEVEFKTQKVLNEYWKNEERSTLVECKQYMNKCKASLSKVLELKDAKEHKVYMTQKYMNIFQDTLHKNIVLSKLK